MSLRASTTVVSFRHLLPVILPDRKPYTDFVQNPSPLHEAAEGADLPKFGPDPVGVARGVAKIKVAYNLVLLAWIPVVCITCV